MCVLSVRLVPSPCGRTDPDKCPVCPACPRTDHCARIESRNSSQGFKVWVKLVEEANAYFQAKLHLLLETP